MCRVEAALLPSPPNAAEREPAPPADSGPEPRVNVLLPSPKGTSAAPSPGREGALWARASPFLQVLGRWWEFLKLETQNFKTRVCLCPFYF